ncbi:hypothetical protein [Massilia sp. CF038]|uniref:hypothetical protein n=1 Tax=Massilia sp. CF038 TaxID=1881045 RepID=UPI000922CF6D|nr:hypothetical protein [Massilia sp. CF038]SHH05116.1 hypothetical protein SAMN05428948_2517 [Massilia sp. CF038]
MKKILLTLLCLLASASSMAQVVNAKGVATVSYTKKITPQQKEAAYVAAQVAAIERYFAENGEAEAENFDAIKPKVEANLDKFVMSTTVLTEQDQPTLSKYSIAVRTEINLAKLRTTLRANSEAGKAAPASNSEMVYVFVAREAASVKSFDAKVVQRRDVEAKGQVTSSVSDKGREGESIGNSSVSTNASRNRAVKVDGSTSVTVTTGGSSTQKTDESTYRVMSMANYRTSVTSVFSQAGFKVSDPDFVLSDADMKSVNADYAKGDDLTPATVRGIVASLRKESIPLVVLATFDAGVPSDDPATGLRRVTVTVTARVLDVQGPRPREVASVPAVQYVAVAPDSTVASTKAMKDASIAASREIVSRLNAGGVR